MKRILKTLLILLVSLLFLVQPFFCFAEKGSSDASENPLIDLTIKPFAQSDVTVSVIELPDNPEDSRYYFFLPSDCDGSVTVLFPYEFLIINNDILHSGDTTDLIAKVGKLNVKTPDESLYSITVVKSDKIPSVYINTESGSLKKIHADKEFKEKGALTLVNNGKEDIAGAKLSHIKGRGNSSWQSNEKRCYSLKFEDKESLLGMNAAKRWALISNNMDPTLMRNALTYSIAQSANLPYTVEFRFIDLYINGIYRGNYMLTEKIEIGKGRIEINDLSKQNELANEGTELSDAKRIVETAGSQKLAYYDIMDPDEISGGYLLEAEFASSFDASESSFLTKAGICMLLHEPEYASKNEIVYVSHLYEQLEEALLSKDGKNRDGKHFSEFIDMDSVIDELLIYELMANSDRGLTSLYLYLPENSSKFFMGPVWDFDMGLTNPNERLMGSEALAGYWPDNDTHSLIYMLMSHDEVIDKMSERLIEFEPLLTQKADASFADIKNLIESSAKADQLRWNYELAQSGDINLDSYIIRRIDFMKQTYNNMDDVVKEIKFEKAPSAQLIIAATVGGALVIAAVAIAVTLKKRKKT